MRLAATWLPLIIVTHNENPLFLMRDNFSKFLYDYMHPATTWLSADYCYSLRGLVAIRANSFFMMDKIYKLQTF